MKRLFFLIIAAGCVVSSCSKADRDNPGQLSSDAFSKAFPVHGPVIVVPPNKDGDGNDTEELTAAFTAAKPGTVVKLLPGTYYAGYMELYGFQGSIIGSGREKTIIILKPSIDQKTQNNANKTSGWWRLIGGDIKMSEITFKTPDGFLSDEGDYFSQWGSDLYSMFMVNNYNDEYYHPEEPQNLMVKNCNFIGGINSDLSHEGYWQTEFNTYLGVWVGVDYSWPKENVKYPLTKGEYVFKDCYFENFLDGVEGFSLGEEATMTVAACKFNNNMWPLFFTANYNSRIYITDNMFTKSMEYEIVIEDLDFGFLPNTEVKPIKRCSYVITGNQFNKSSVSSIFLCDIWIGTDPTQRLPMLFTIKGNRFNLSGNVSAITAINSQDPVIRNNNFQGTGDMGILIDGAIKDLYGYDIPLEVYAKNALLLGNNFSGLKTTTAAVVLGEKSMNCTVVGTGKEKVIDDGINNKVTGMKKVPGGHHFGPAIRDNLRMWQGLPLKAKGKGVH